MRNCDIKIQSLCERPAVGVNITEPGYAGNPEQQGSAPGELWMMRICNLC